MRLLIQQQLPLLLSLSILTPGSMSGNENSGKPPAPSYRTSDGTLFVPADHYPIWSWETVQEFKALANTKGYAPTDEQIARIASLSNFVSVQGAHAVEEFGSEKRGPIKGLRREVSRLKATNPDIKVCGYYNSVWAWWFTSPENVVTEQDKKDLFFYDDEAGTYYRRSRPKNGNYAFDIHPSVRARPCLGRSREGRGQDNVEIETLSITVKEKGNS